MKYDISLLFLRREHLIIITRMLILNDPNPIYEQQINQIDWQNQREEQIFLQMKWSNNDLDYLQNQLLQIVNLTFSYYKLHFPVNSTLSIKDHIKFVQIIRQLNYNGTSLSDVFKWQRYRLQQDRMKLLRSQKLLDEPIFPKIANYKVDLAYLSQLLNKYYNRRNLEYRQPYQILNVFYKKKLQRITNRTCMSITSLEEVPQLQLINTNLIQPILNYDQLNNSFQKRMTKLMNRNSLVQQSIQKYYSQRNSRAAIYQIKILEDLPTISRKKQSQTIEQEFEFVRSNDRNDKQLIKPIDCQRFCSGNGKETLETILDQKIKRHHTSSEREETTKQISRSQLLRSVKSEHLLLESEMYKKFLMPIKQQKIKMKQQK